MNDRDTAALYARDPANARTWTCPWAQLRAQDYGGSGYQDRPRYGRGREWTHLADRPQFQKMG